MQTKDASVYLMNPKTGSVDTKENWLAEMGSWTSGEPGEPGAITPWRQFDSLIEVQLASGELVPSDFNPAHSDQYDWTEVEASV